MWRHDLRGRMRWPGSHWLCKRWPSRWRLTRLSESAGLLLHHDVLRGHLLLLHLLCLTLLRRYTIRLGRGHAGLTGLGCGGIR